MQIRQHGGNHFYKEDCVVWGIPSGMTIVRISLPGSRQVAGWSPDGRFLCLYHKVRVLHEHREGFLPGDFGVVSIYHDATWTCVARVDCGPNPPFSVLDALHGIIRIIWHPCGHSFFIEFDSGMRTKLVSYAPEQD